MNDVLVQANGEQTYGDSSDFNLNIETHEGEFNPNEVKFLVYAESGVGKTVFGASWPNCLFLDMDFGMSSVKSEVMRVAIKEWSDLEDAYMFLAHGNHSFQTVVVDSLNEMQYVAMDHIITSYPAIRRAYNDLASQSDYGKMLADFDKMVRKIRGLDLNVVFIANVQKQEFETDIIQPQFVGKNTARNMARMMDVVGYLYKSDTGDPVKTRVMVFDDARFVTKDRSSDLPPAVDNPTYSKLYQYWTGQFQPTE